LVKKKGGEDPMSEFFSWTRIAQVNWSCKREGGGHWWRVFLRNKLKAGRHGGEESKSSIRFLIRSGRTGGIKKVTTRTQLNSAPQEFIQRGEEGESGQPTS